VATQVDIAVSYDVSNEFFAVWLDRRMNYSCALFEGTDDLEVAQLNKLAYIHDAAHVEPDKPVLDIGCGWGANLRYLTEDRGVGDATGITLSSAQYEHLRRHPIRNATVQCVNYRDYQPERRFRAVISIGMFEHVASPEDTRTGRHLEIYRDYFRRAWTWTEPGSWFALQSVIAGSVKPRKLAHALELIWGSTTIFPNSMAPELGAICDSVAPYWEVVEVKTRREHYMRTADEWRKRLHAHENQIVERWGVERFREYDRYLAACVLAFENGYQALAQLSLRRVD